MPASGDKAADAAMPRVRRFVPGDASSGVEILKESPEASIWSEEGLLESATLGIAWVAESRGRVAGLLVGRIAADEFEILNMAVARDFRRQGIATQLLRVAIGEAESAAATKTYLEVRASNQGGIALYTGFGFRECGRRPGYYRDPVEDAVLMLLHKDEKLQ